MDRRRSEELEMKVVSSLRRVKWLEGVMLEQASSSVVRARCASHEES